MLDVGDNVVDTGPTTEAYGVQPVGIDEQIRRAAPKRCEYAPKLRP